MRINFGFAFVTFILSWQYSNAKVKFPDELNDIIEFVHNTCVANTGVTEEIISGCANGEFPDDRKLKCYMFCLFEEASFVDDGGAVDYDMLISMIPDEYRDRVAIMINGCRHLDATKKDGCDRAFDVHKCLYQKDPEFYFLF